MLKSPVVQTTSLSIYCKILINILMKTGRTTDSENGRVLVEVTYQLTYQQNWWELALCNSIYHDTLPNQNSIKSAIEIYLHSLHSPTKWNYLKVLIEYWYKYCTFAIMKSLLVVILSKYHLKNGRFGEKINIHWDYLSHTYGMAGGGWRSIIQ